MIPPGVPVTARLLLVDDSQFARAAIKRLLAERAEWQICAEAADGVEAVEIAKTQCPDLAILDIEMSRKNGIEAAKEIIKYCPETIVISNSVHDPAAVLRQLKDAGVRAFVPKNRLGMDLIPTIEAVLGGATLFEVPKARTT
jgi:DNA-binding NarL/FixJ family response regulator